MISPRRRRQRHFDSLFLKGDQQGGPQVVTRRGQHGAVRADRRSGDYCRQRLELPPRAETENLSDEPRGGIEVDRDEAAPGLSILPELNAAREVVSQGVLIEREHPAVLDEHDLAAEVEDCRVIPQDAESGLGRSHKPALCHFDALGGAHKAEAAPVVGEREQRRGGVEQEELARGPSAVIAGLERVARQASVEAVAIVKDTTNGSRLELPRRNLDLKREVGGENIGCRWRGE